jgi:hypothetical protein
MAKNPNDDGVALGVQTAHLETEGEQQSRDYTAQISKHLRNLQIPLLPCLR